MSTIAFSSSYLQASKQPIEEEVIDTKKVNISLSHLVSEPKENNIKEDVSPQILKWKSKLHDHKNIIGNIIIVKLYLDPSLMNFNKKTREVINKNVNLINETDRPITLRKAVNVKVDDKYNAYYTPPITIMLINSKPLRISEENLFNISSSILKKDADVLKNIPFLSKKNVHKIAGNLATILNDDLTIKDFAEMSKNINQSILLATGLSCEAGKSQGIPFDVLGFFSSAEVIKKTLGYKGIIHLIADEHARSKGFDDKNFASNEELIYEAELQKKLYETLAEKLGIQTTYKIVFASEYHNSKEFQELKKTVESKLPVNIKEGITPYTQLEIADIEYFRKYKNADIKISWVLHESDKGAKRDETSYDNFNKKVFPENEGNDISFIYTKSGVNLELKPDFRLDTSSIDCAPYSYPKNQQRILLDTKENSTIKLSQFKEGLENHKQTRKNSKPRILEAVEDKLNSICSTYSIAFGNAGGEQIDAKINNIIARVFKEK